jgi:uncharacterized protein YecE (DUF72 family)
MEFGRVENPELVDFTIPTDHPDTERILKSGKKPLEIYVGCAKFNSKELKGLYPKGVKTKEELNYYSTQFNSIEFNGTFRTFVTKLPVDKWREETVDGFKFFPKMSNMVSQFRRLRKDSIELSEEFCNDLNSRLGDKLGIVFVQMIDNFSPKDFDAVEDYCQRFPQNTKMALEVRHKDWFGEKYSEEYFKLLEKYNITNVLVDTPGRRDMMHMRLTTPIAFIRWVGSNHHDSDRKRLEDWIPRLKAWKDQGLEELCFFVHQNDEIESPALCAHLIERLNKELGCNLTVPKIVEEDKSVKPKVEKQEAPTEKKKAPTKRKAKEVSE